MSTFEHIYRLSKLQEADQKDGRQRAKIWLNKQLAKYGNTCYFPDEVKARLNKLIAKYGNTYFWK